MRYNCPQNTKETNITYVRNRIEPNYFIVYYKNVAQIRLTPKEVGRVFGVAKFTPSVNSIRDWCYEMINKYGSEEEKEDEVKAEVDPTADADAIMAVVAPALDALRAEILEALAEKQVEEEVEEEEVEMQETKLSITERFGAVASMFKDVNY